MEAAPPSLHSVVGIQSTTVILARGPAHGCRSHHQDARLLGMEHKEPIAAGCRVQSQAVAVVQQLVVLSSCRLDGVVPPISSCGFQCNKGLTSRVLPLQTCNALQCNSSQADGMKQCPAQ